MNTERPTPRPLTAINTARMIAVIFTHFLCIAFSLFHKFIRSGNKLFTERL